MRDAVHHLVGDDVGRDERRSVIPRAKRDHASPFRAKRGRIEERVVLAFAADIDHAENPTIPPAHAAPPMLCEEVDTPYRSES